MIKTRRKARLSLAYRGLVLTSLAVLLVTLLSACGMNGEPNAGSTDSDLASGPGYLLTVDLSEGETREGLLAQYGGEIVAWVDGEFAILGLDEEPEQGFSTLSSGHTVEPNARVSSGINSVTMQGTSGLWAGGTSSLWAGGTSSIWAGGTSSIWAGGTSTLWAGGTSWLWAGGEYDLMPENTGVFKQIALDRAHRLVGDSLGFGVRVAVVDTGVDLGHPAFSDAGVIDPGPDYVDGDLHPQEEGGESNAGYGHGTNVAGIVRQVAPRATIIPIRILDEEGRGDAANLARAIIWAVTDGDADVINLSLGGADHVQAVAKALRFAANRGVFVIASTGDSGTMEVTYPANEAHRSDMLLSLASVDENDNKSSFSPYHPVQVELSAPGERIYSAAPRERQAAWSGTSMAAPMASGALALALGAPQEGFDLDVRSDRLAVELAVNSDNIDWKNSWWHRGKLGTGRLNVAKFLEAVLDDKPNHGRGGWNDRDPWDRGGHWDDRHPGNNGRGNGFWWDDRRNDDPRNNGRDSGRNDNRGSDPRDNGRNGQDNGRDNGPRGNSGRGFTFPFGWGR